MSVVPKFRGDKEFLALNQRWDDLFQSCADLCRIASLVIWQWKGLVPHLGSRRYMRSRCVCIQLPLPTPPVRPRKKLSWVDVCTLFIDIPSFQLHVAWKATSRARFAGDFFHC